jgi:hypothetical protein
MLFAAAFAERSHSLEIADDPRRIVNVVTSTRWATVQCPLVYFLTSIANSDFDVCAKVVASSESGHIKQTQELGFAQRFFEIQMQCRATIQVLDHFFTVKEKLLDHVGLIFLHNVEVGIIAIAGNDIPICAFTPHPHVERQLALSYGCSSVHFRTFHSIESVEAEARRYVRASGLAQKGDTIVIAAGIPFGTIGGTNLLLVQTL